MTAERLAELTADLSPTERKLLESRIGTLEQFNACVDAMNERARGNWTRYAKTARTERQRAGARRVVRLIEAQA